VLKAGLEGVKREVKPPEALEEDIYENGRYKMLDRLPATLIDALNAFGNDELIFHTLKPAAKEFLDLKRKEWEEFTTRRVTDWELERYLDL
jgi:glutamine synthetase